MKHLYVFRVYDTGKGDKHCDTKLLQEKIKERLGVAADWITRHEYMGYNSYVLIGYERDKALEGEDCAKLFENVMNEIGNLSDVINFELKIEFLPAVTSTIVTPDSMAKKGKAKCATCDKCPDGCADCDEESEEEKESEEDEWAEVKRLRDLAKH